MPANPSEPRFYSVSRAGRAPLVEYIRNALESCGCRLLHVPGPGFAPSRFTFETPEGERMGVLVYAFFANSKTASVRLRHEYEFRVECRGVNIAEWGFIGDGKADDLFITLLCGIDLEHNIMVGADPSIKRDNPFQETVAFDAKEAEIACASGWHAWEREPGEDEEGQIEILVGHEPGRFLDYIRFEREARYEEAGIRHWLADRYSKRAPVD